MIVEELIAKAEATKKCYDLLVGSVKDGEGKVRIYEDTRTDGDFSKAEPVVYGGFAEVKDITYKERIY